MQSIVDRAATDIIGKTLSYMQIRRWAGVSVDSNPDADPVATKEIAELLGAALLRRAEAYMRKAEKIASTAEQRVDVYYETWQRTDGQCREMNTIVNAAKMRIEHCERMACKLSPDLYSDYVYEIRRITDQIKSMGGQLDRLINR